MNTDSQPNALLISIIALVVAISSGLKIKHTKDFHYLFIIAFFSLIVLVTFSSDFLWGIRSMGNYISIYLITLMCYICLNTFGIVKYKFYEISIWIWFAVGVIQKFVYNGFLLFLVPRNYGGEHLEHLAEEGRGIIALAPEATYYGFVCVQFIMFGLLNYRHCPRFYRNIGLLLIQLLLLAKSTGAFINVAAAIVVVVILNKAFLKKTYRYIVAGIFALILVFPFMVSSNSRMGSLLNRMWNGDNIIASDDSTNERFLHMFFSLKGSLYSGFLPHGYENFGDYYYQECRSLSSDMITAYTMRLAGSTDKIMSSIGGLFYELGVFGMIPFILVIYNLYAQFHKNYILLFCLVLFVIITLNALPFGQGFNCLLLANMLYIKDNNYVNHSPNQLYM